VELRNQQLALAYRVHKVLSALETMACRDPPEPAVGRGFTPAHRRRVLEQTRREASSGKRGEAGALANKREAAFRAHARMLTRSGRIVPAKDGRINNGQAHKRAANSRAAALASTIRQLMAAGFVSQRELANELNRRGIPTALGGSWHRTTVARMLTRIGLVTSGNRNIGRTNKQAADARAKALASTIRALQATGLVSFSAIARELNQREIPTARGGKWHPCGVSRLLHRLERLEPSSRTVVTPDE
jgi:hypothetical protein